MFHSGTQRLIDLWFDLPGASRIPMRADFDPVALGRTLPQAVIIDRGHTALPVRLAGGWVETLHGALLQGTDWLALWERDSRPLIRASVVQAFREARPIVIAAAATRSNGVYEIVIAPLRGPDGTADRVIGLYQWTRPADRVARDIGPMTARMAVGVGPVGRAPLVLAALNGRRVA